MDLLRYNNPNFDLGLLNEIADGSSAFIVETIDLFLQQAPELLLEINNGIQTGSWDAVGASAHKLKGTLGMFGMDTSHELIQQVEKGAKNRTDLDPLPAKFEELKQIVESTYPDLLKIRAELLA